MSANLRKNEDPIHPEAYAAITMALARYWWFKASFQANVRFLLGRHHELLAGLDFGLAKQVVADEIAVRLARGELRYRATTVTLLATLADYTQFSELRGQPDGLVLVSKAESAAKDLQIWATRYAPTAGALSLESTAQERSQQLSTAPAGVRNALLAQLRADFLSLQGAADRQKAGLCLEGLVTALLRLEHLDPRLSYRLQLSNGVQAEQIDGSFVLDGMHFIIEIKWYGGVVGRRELDVFAKQIERKGMNAQGLFLSVNGFSRSALETYRSGAPFIAMDGVDLHAVLDDRVLLADLLRAKKRHAADTGSCYLAARDIIGGYPYAG